jgi:hypothetical protein
MKFVTRGNVSLCYKFEVKITSKPSPYVCESLKLVKIGTDIAFSPIKKSFEMKTGKQTLDFS